MESRDLKEKNPIQENFDFSKKPNSSEKKQLDLYFRR